MKPWIIAALLVVTSAALVAQQQPAQDASLAQLERKVNTLTVRVNDLESQLIQGKQSEIPLYQRKTTSPLRVDGLGNGGWYVLAGDGSAWDIQPEDAKLTQNWNSGHRLQVYYVGAGRYPYVLVNVDRGGSNPEAVRAAYMIAR